MALYNCQTIHGAALVWQYQYSAFAARMVSEQANFSDMRLLADWVKKTKTPAYTDFYPSTIRPVHLQAAILIPIPLLPHLHYTPFI